MLKFIGKMCEKFFLRHGYSMLAFILFIGQVSAAVACRGDFYQPKVPEALIRR